MLNNKGPLMFINTVNTQIEDSSEQKVFDSRVNQKKNKSNLNESSNKNEGKTSVEMYSPSQEEVYSSSQQEEEYLNYQEDEYQEYSTEAYSNSFLEAYPEEVVRPKFIEERKIKNIIEMYHKDRPVLCNIISNDIEIIGIPFKLDDSLLYIKTSEDQCENIKLDEITDIIIIKF